MMKRIVPILLGLVCIPFVLAGYDDGLITSGEYEYSVEWFTDSPPLIVEGGGADGIQMWDSSCLEVRNTSTPINGNWNTGGIMDINLDDYSHLKVTGGYISVVDFRDNATGELHGGNIEFVRSFQHAYSTHIDLYCQPGWSWTYTSGNITGVTGLWGNGTAFTIGFVNQTGFSYDPVWKNINVIEVPEPATLALIGLGGLLIRCKK